MQKAGDSTHESSCSVTAVGIPRWFPNGFETEGVDWSAFEEHLALVPDMACEVTSAARTLAAVGTVLGNATQQSLPRGVCALHLAVSCRNPTAPKSVIRQLITINPDALSQTEEPHGWNVLHCAFKFNSSFDDYGEGILEMLLNARPELISDGATSLDDFGLPPLAFCQSKSIVSKLVRIMPIKTTTSILKRIFMKRRLLGGSIEAMEQIVREMSMLELQQGRSTLVEGILPEKLLLTRGKQNVVAYMLQQVTSKPKTNHESHRQETMALMRLVDIIVQAIYCFCFRKLGVGLALSTSTCPPSAECLKVLVTNGKVKKWVLGLYHAAKNGDSFEYHGQQEDLEQGAACRYDLFGETASINFPPRPTAITSVASLPEKLTIETERLEFSASNTCVDKLFKCKEELDDKVNRSLNVLKQAVASLENYKEAYTATIEKLYNEAQGISPLSSDSSSVGDDDSGGVLSMAKNAKEEHASLRALIAMSSLPSSSPKRQKSDDSSGKNAARSFDRHVLEEAVQGTIENMTAASVALDTYNRNISTESANLVRQQENLKAMDMSYFKNADHQQSVRAIMCVAEHQLQREGLIKCVDDIKRQLKDVESMDDREARTGRHIELNLRWVKLTTEVRDLSREIEVQREIISGRRHDLGGHMVTARRILHGKIANRVVKTRATRFLREAKKEMRELMAALTQPAPIGSSRNRRQRKKCRQQHLQDHQKDEQKALEEEEELARMTKRMKL
jgi:hypothetical protein